MSLGSARSLELDLAQRKKEGGLGRHGKLRGDRERRRAASGAIADAWTRSPATTAAVWASGHSAEHRRDTVNSFELFWLVFDQLKLQISYGNMKFGQNKSCRGKEDLQLSFWAKVDLEPGSMIKTRSKTAKQCLTRGLG